MCQGKGDCVFIGNLVQSAIRLCCIMHMQGVLSTLKTPCFVRRRIYRLYPFLQLCLVHGTDAAIGTEQVQPADSHERIHNP